MTIIMTPGGASGDFFFFFFFFLFFFFFFFFCEQFLANTHAQGASAQWCVNHLHQFKRFSLSTCHVPCGTQGQFFLSYLSCSLADCWGTTVDFATSFLHSSRFSAFNSMLFHSRPVHSLMLSSHRFLCLPHFSY